MKKSIIILRMEDLQNLPLDISFDIPSLIAGFLFGVTGYWIFRQGRKTANNPVIASGLGLMIYPYFVQGALWNWVVGFLFFVALIISGKINRLIKKAHYFFTNLFI